MSGLLDDVNLRTQLVGHNRLELLLFVLHSNQRYGINVFKVHEVIQCPPLTRIPNAHPVICGVATLRGKTIPIFDLAKAIGQASLADGEGSVVIVTEYNRSVQGFLVRGVDRIVNINWERVVPPPEGVGHDHFLTAIAHVDKDMVELIDVERVLSNVSAGQDEESVQVVESLPEVKRSDYVVLVADDSLIARNQVKKTLNKMGLESVVCKNGKEAYEKLMEWQENNDPMLERLLMLVSDIEMPEMDGYTLTARIRNNAKLRNIYVLLHTSLSGVFNSNLIQQVDANAFVAKFDASDLAEEIVKRLDCVKGKEVKAPGTH
jgi:two-component system, chemotaxis family, chemotaxis protein CheV